MTREELFTFHPDEQEIYERQIRVLHRDLHGAPDALSNFTCHSLPHVREVMEQAEHLFDGLRGWLSGEIGFASHELETARVHVLLAAKFHDVGMAGTETQQLLLDHVDKMHADYGSAAAAPYRRAAADPGALETLRALASRADRECTHWDKRAHLEDSLCGRILFGGVQSNMNDLFAQYHEAVKNAIRSYHGENSGRWIAEHRQVLAERYGPGICWDTVILLAALHTGDLCCHTNEHGVRQTWVEYAHRLCSLYGISAPAAEQPEALRKLFALVSIVRLADQRRTGSRLLTLDLREIRVITKANGALQIEYMVGGVKHRPRMSVSNQIMLAEKLNEFGPVTLARSGDMWLMTHELRFAMREHAQARQLLCTRRIPAYVQEMTDSAFTAEHGVRHRLLIRSADAAADEPAGTVLSFSIDELLAMKRQKEDSVAFALLDGALEGSDALLLEIIS